MKKIVSILLMLSLLGALLAGCKSEEKPALTVATSPDFAPMIFCDMSKSGQEQYVGFDALLAQYIADELGMELKILPMSFDACPGAVSSGKATLAISGFSWMPERAESYNLSDYYFAGDNETEQVVVTLKENKDKFKTAEDFNGVKVGAQSASFQEALCKEQLAGATIVPVPDLSTALMQLKKGDFDAVALAKGQAGVFMANDDAVALCDFAFTVDPKYVGNVVILKKGDDELTAKVNAILAKAKDAGLYEVWYAQAQVLAGSKTAAEVGYDENGNPVPTESAGE